MSSSGRAHVTIDVFSLDPQKLPQQPLKGLRIAYAASGAVAMILGINFLITGAIKVAVGIFSHCISAGMRVLEVLLGLFIMVIILGVIGLVRAFTFGKSVLAQAWG
ncbi:hypothetical protein AAGW05_08175 [Arthrobacter sp. LAPM80]|uniref:hypothetical protein n=1 Tax=Arthrobacter sp. LAPM80 TaxID=3141788 RepID=UPI00398B57AE